MADNYEQNFVFAQITVFLSGGIRENTVWICSCLNALTQWMGDEHKGVAIISLFLSQ